MGIRNIQSSIMITVIINKLLKSLAVFDDKLYDMMNENDIRIPDEEIKLIKDFKAGFVQSSV